MVRETQPGKCLPRKSHSQDNCKHRPFLSVTAEAELRLEVFALDNHHPTDGPCHFKLYKTSNSPLPLPPFLVVDLPFPQRARCPSVKGQSASAELGAGLSLLHCPASFMI